MNFNELTWISRIKVGWADKSAVRTINDSVGKNCQDVQTSGNLLILQARQGRFWACRPGRFAARLRLHMHGDALQIEPSGNGEMMQMRLGQSLVGRAPQSREAQRLGERAFDASTPPILLHKGWAALPRSPLPQGGMHLWWPQGEGAPLLPMRTRLAHGTGAAGGLPKANDHARLLAAIARL